MSRRVLIATIFVLSGLTLATARGGTFAPAAAPITEVELGRLLFWDPILSGEKDVACASCHHPDFAYADGRELSLGAAATGLGPNRMAAADGRIPVVKRNSQTVLNTVFNAPDRRGRRRGDDAGASARAQASAPMFWDSRVRSLEAQALEPLEAREEMRGDAYPEDVALDSVVARLRAIPEYVTLFAEVYGPDAPVDAEHLGRAIAGFERTLVAMDAPFDRYQAGDRTAMTPEQIRGMETFDDAGCERCHDGTMFTDFDLEAEGVAEHPGLAQPDTGAGRFRFRTPSLRNVGLTAPYMHNGTLATLEDVLRFYDDGRSRNPNVVDDRRGRRGGRRGDRGAASLSDDFRRVDDMSEQEMREIIAFLHALTDDTFDRTIPERVPSGLTPGGAIR